MPIKVSLTTTKRIFIISSSIIGLYTLWLLATYLGSIASFSRPYTMEKLFVYYSIFLRNRALFIVNYILLGSAIISLILLIIFFIIWFSSYSNSRLARRLRLYRDSAFVAQQSTTQQPSESIYCYKCGSKNPATKQFCGDCGAKLAKDT